MSLRDVTVVSRDLPLSSLDEPRLVARAKPNPEKLEELASNIKLNGLLEPLIVFPVGDRFEIAAGHRRLIAARRAGLVVVPCRVYNSAAEAMEAAKHAENRFRQDLSAGEEALYFAELIERDYSGDVDGLAGAIGESRAYVESRLLLLQGGQDVFDALLNDVIGIGVAQELNKCTDPGHRSYLLNCALRGGATKAVVTGWLQQWQQQQRLTAGAPAPVSGGEKIAPVATSNYFTCYACKGTDHVENMRPMNVHDYCVPAILEPALTKHRNQADFIRFPNTREDALALLTRVVERFPELADHSA